MEGTYLETNKQNTISSARIDMYHNHGLSIAEEVDLMQRGYHMLFMLEFLD